MGEKIMPSKSKIKGSSWERDVAKILSNLYNQSFIRVPNSGAYVGGKNVNRKTFLQDGQVRAFKGDIIPPDSWIHFNCECKSYADFPFHLLVSGKITVLEGWINQVMQTSDDGDLNILFMKFNRKGKFVAIPCSTPNVTVSNHAIYHSVNHGSWIFTEFDCFLSNNKDQLLLWSC